MAGTRSKDNLWFDAIVGGAGFAGSVVAERLAARGKRVLLVEKRSHIGGNAYDEYDENGVLVHRYGPHIFHTKIKRVWDYLSEFTEWRIYQHRVLGVIEGKKVPIPFNMNSLRVLFPENFASKLEQKLVNSFGYGVKVPILDMKKSDDPDVKFLADYVYEKVFLHYTMKQWGVKPEEIDPSVTARVPVYVSRDDRYFTDPYQAMPLHGYTSLFENMLFESKSARNIKVLLNTDFREIVSVGEDGYRVFGMKFDGALVYTGPVDYLFDYAHGVLPYRSLRFDFKNYPVEYFQEAGTVNYPNEYDFTRITEFKHLSGQKHPTTTVVYEYPQNYEVGKNEPYYPVPGEDNQKKYQKYLKEVEKHEGLFLVGRLAEYRYYNMDQIVERALNVAEEVLRFLERVS